MRRTAAGQPDTQKREAQKRTKTRRLPQHFARGMSPVTKTRNAHYSYATGPFLVRAAERDLLGPEREGCPPPFAASQAAHIWAIAASTVMRCSTELNQWSMGTNTRRMTR